MKQYLIIGNGIAATGCIEGIRSIDQTGAITVISAERHPVYCRPLISYYLEQKTTLERMNYRAADFYETNGCAVRYGATAERIDPQHQTVCLDDGSELPYDALCVATGSSPFLPPMEGLDTVQQQFTFLTLDDAMALQATVTKQSRVLILGAGLIGLKCAEGLHGLAGSITVCDLADRVLSSILDADCAARMQAHLEANGITCLLGDSVTRFTPQNAVLSSGKTVAFDLLVLAVGVRANTALLRAIGGTVNRGIVVTDTMETSVDGIYAAGDCTEGYDCSLGENRVLALLPNAYLQGHAAGVNMAGGTEQVRQAIPMNAMGLFGLHLMTAGSYLGECYEETNGDAFKRLYIKDGLLKGFILMGGTERAGIYTALIRAQTRLDTLDFALLKKTASTAAFFSETRRKMFGGVV